MSITATQKIIKVGTSGMVTVPAKSMRQMGISYSDEVADPAGSRADSYAGY